MVNRRIVSIAVAAILAAVGVAVVLYLSSDERKVKKRFTELAELSSKGPEESMLVAARKIQGVALLFDERCTFRTHIPEVTGTFTPEDVSGLLSRARQYFKTIEIAFVDLDIAFTGDAGAEVSLTSRVRLGGGPGGEGLDEIHELLCILVKKDGEWRFREIEVVSVLEK